MSMRSSLSPGDIGLIALSIVSGSFGQVMLRFGARDIYHTELPALFASALTSAPVLVGLAAYTISSLLWIIVLSRVSLAVAYPLGAANYLVVAMLATLLGENVSPMRWLGTLIIVAGVVLVGAGKRESS